MERWQNKLAVVTGASSGIGAACSRAMIAAGLRVVALARREKKLKELSESLPSNLKQNLIARCCDVSKEEQVISTFDWIQRELGGADVLLNNAGITRETELVAARNTQKLRDVIDTNLMGVIWCTREMFHNFKSRNTEGHVFIVNSIAGHQVLNFIGVLPSFNIYPATKFAITAITETYRQEFQLHTSKVRVTGICPGAVNTNIFPEEIHFYVKNMARLQPSNIADAILYALRTPPNVQIHEITIKPMGEIF
ncbi:LOW QUALITY PROTEIN: farnesol dehydrogenase [Drosophila sulfurigaster albostrigata]|uniref:LOW QUALITY PROTEIN: farnesol dehydrogenase n=1 Tax=Drosophila sulfurigaster albostrigata TaxID=89887 RepID=UPI002D21EA5E|nr:LOW QUALITY PROTEIN: farnesol dehydrogenase [Drosophila sulfurigaster albostrigata]